jgi:hypothetical protein
MLTTLIEYMKSKLAQKSVATYLGWIFILLILFVLGYLLGKTSTATLESNRDLSELLTTQYDLPLNNIELIRNAFGGESYFPFDSETNILRYVYVQYNGTYLPTNAQFSLRHTINIYRPGHVPSVTATKILYNDSIAHNGDVELLSLSGMDDNSWGFCYTQTDTCYIESKYNDLVSQIGIVVSGADEKQMSEILRMIVSGFYERVESSKAQFK